MKDYYLVNPNDLLHYGTPRHSGRYPWGSGDRPYQNREERKAARKEKRDSKNLSIGRERLQNRIKRANNLADVDKLSKKIGWESTQKASEAHRQVKNIKQLSSEILESEERTKALGDYTRKVRIGTLALTSTAASTLALGGSAFILGALEAPLGAVILPLAAGTTAAKIGYEYFQKTKY